MRQGSNSFKQAITGKTRELTMRIRFTSGITTYTLTAENLKTCKYHSSMEQELGGIEKKVMTIDFFSNTDAKFIQKDTELSIEYGVKLYSSWYYDTPEKYIVTGVKAQVGKPFIQVEAVDALTLVRLKPLPFISQAKDTTLKNYLAYVSSCFSKPFSFDTSLKDQNLSLAFCKSTHTHDTLLEFAIASQSLLKTNFKFASVIKKSSVYNLSYSVGLIQYATTLDQLSQYTDARVQLYYPNLETSKTLGQFTKTIPTNATHFSLGQVKFKELVIPEVICFNQYVTMADYVLGSDRCELFVSLTNTSDVELQTTFMGLDINAFESSETDASNKTKFIRNIYIQSSTDYDTRIYTKPQINISYIGNPLLEVGDIITVDANHTVLIYEHTLTFTGKLRGTVKGVILNA